MKNFSADSGLPSNRLGTIPVIGLVWFVAMVAAGVCCGGGVGVLGDGGDGVLCGICTDVTSDGSAPSIDGSGRWISSGIISGFWGSSVIALMLLFRGDAPDGSPDEACFLPMYGLVLISLSSFSHFSFSLL